MGASLQRLRLITIKGCKTMHKGENVKGIKHLGKTKVRDQLQKKKRGLFSALGSIPVTSFTTFTRDSKGMDLLSHSLCTAQVLQSAGSYSGIKFLSSQQKSCIKTQAQCALRSQRFQIAVRLSPPCTPDGSDVTTPA